MVFAVSAVLSPNTSPGWAGVVAGAGDAGVTAGGVCAGVCAGD
jgi:hypothetical protein